VCVTKLRRTDSWVKQAKKKKKRRFLRVVTNFEIQQEHRVAKGTANPRNTPAAVGYELSKATPHSKGTLGPSFPEANKICEPQFE
jgi:hypothetical protein